MYFIYKKLFKYVYATINQSLRYIVLKEFIILIIIF